jgi:alginate O-acetyltransferase complex protein AlgJ
MERTKRTYSVILMILFLMVISIVMVNDVFQFSVAPKVLYTEKRFIAKKPVVNINRLDMYPDSCDRFYNDRFPFRLDLMDLYAGMISVSLFHRSPYPKLVEFGKNGWMYFTSEGDIYKRKFMLSDDWIQKMADEIHNRAEYYHDKGIKFYFAIPPIKQEIYPEFLPPGYFQLPGKSVTDKVIDLIRKDTMVRFIDLKRALIDAKKYGILYLKTDNHWNAFGGYWGYRAVIERIKQDFPAIKPIDTTDVTFTPKIIDGGNMATNMHISKYVKDVEMQVRLKAEIAREGPLHGYQPRPSFSYPQEFEKVRLVNNPALPRMLAVRDSYFYGVFPFIIENFSKSVILYDTGVYGIFDEAVQTEKPDLVLYMIFEPHMLNLIGVTH